MTFDRKLLGDRTTAFHTSSHELSFRSGPLSTIVSGAPLPRLTGKRLPSTLSGNGRLDTANDEVLRQRLWLIFGTAASGATWPRTTRMACKLSVYPAVNNYKSGPDVTR